MVLATVAVHGQETLRYRSLEAVDATGRALPAWLQLDEQTRRLRVDDTSARYPVTIDPFVERATLTASDGSGQDHLGLAVAVSGDTIVVGQRHATLSGPDVGAAYVFTRSADGWVSGNETAKLTASDGQRLDEFGLCVAIDNDTIVVGAYGVNHSQGAAYIFTRPAGGWVSGTETAKLVFPEGEEGHHFGISVAVEGDTLVVGASSADIDGKLSQGAAYIFTRPTGGNWMSAKVATLTASDGAESDALGRSVDVSADTVVVGASSADVDGTVDAGAAYVFERPEGGWASGTETAKLTASDVTDQARLGEAVAIDGDTVVATATGANLERGAAYVFTAPPAGWANGTETAQLSASDPANARFGESVAVDGEAVVVGAPDREAAYVYVRPEGGWGSGTETIKAVAGVGGIEEAFGEAVALDGDTIVVGAPSVFGAGAAHVFGPAIATSDDSDGDGMLDEDELAYGLDPNNPMGEHGPTGDPNRNGIANIDEVNGVPPSHPRGFRGQFFAEGATGFFRTNIGVFNASRTELAHVLVTLFTETPGDAVSLPFTLEPLQRRSIDVNAELGTRRTGISARVQSDQPVAATRQMLWGEANYGSTLGGSPAVRGGFFAEGSTYFSDLFYLLANPSRDDANVTIQYLRPSGEPITQRVAVPALSRRTIWANSVPGLESTEVAAIVSADAPIVPERAMYSSVGRRGFEAGHVSVGTVPRSEWVFVQGATHFFDTFLLFANPNDEAAQVTITYLLPDGTSLTKAHELPAWSRRTIFVDEEDPRLSSTTVSMRVSSSQDIVAERAMWWGPSAASWYESHATPGQRGDILPFSGYDTWAIGEAASGGPTAEDTYVFVSNESDERGEVRFTLVYDDDTSEQRTFDLQPNASLAVLIRDHFPGAEGKRFSILVESLSRVVGHEWIQAPITVEYARYQSTEGRFGNAGGAALATRIRPIF